MKALLFTLALVHAGAVGAGWSHLSGIAAATTGKSRLDERQAVIQVVERYQRPPVNAKLDRVWHVIPGLAGWQLDTPASERATLRARDHRVHLVWKAIPPKVQLKNLQPEPIYRGPKEEKSVSLMINVSWGEEYVPGLLRALQTAKVPATFFLDGAWVKKHPNMAKDILAAGYEVGSHGSGHPDFRRISNAALERQIVDTNAVIRHTLGIDPILLAPPGGSFDDRTVVQARRHNMYTILWTADTLDWRTPPPDAIVERIRQSAEPGALVLMHPTQPTVQALPMLIDMLKSQGYTFKSVGQVVREQPVVVPPSSLSPKS